MNEPEKKTFISRFPAFLGGGESLLRRRQAFRWHCFVIALITAFIGMPVSAFSGESPGIVFEVSELTIVHGDNRYHFRIEVANTGLTRQRGLMERRHLDANAGMLFDYGTPKQIHMWMKNTFIPLDMVFIDKFGKIIGIVANTTPLSTKVIASPGPVLAVLELNAGTAARLSIEIGDRIVHELFQP